MRLKGQEKVGFYPTPPDALKAIASHISILNASARLLDPCAGEGEALATIAKKCGGKTYGVELSHVRAQKATSVLDEIINADYHDVTTRNDAYSVLFLNPPYDWEYGEMKEGQKRMRMEYEFLINTEKKLMRNGLLVYVVPLLIIQMPVVARRLSSHFDNIKIFRFNNEEYAAYKQVVVFGTRKGKIQKDDEVRDKILHLGNNPDELEILSVVDETDYVVDKSYITDKAFFFRKISLSPEEAAELVETFGVHNTNKQFGNDVAIDDMSMSFKPLMPPRTGHIAMIIASGLMAVTKFGSLVARGSSRKVKVKVGETEETETYVERYRTEIYTYDTETKEYKVIVKQDELEEFMEEHARELGRIIREDYEPLYKKPTKQELQRISHVARGVTLPNRKETGLMEAQKHVAIAAHRSIEEYGFVNIVAEMGFGKTFTALAVLELTNDWPAIVMCPSHLTTNWVAEIKRALPGVPAAIIKSMEDMDRFAQMYQKGQRAVAIMSKESARNGSGWTVETGHRIIATDDYTGTVCSCPTCGTPLKNRDDFFIVNKGQLKKKVYTCHKCGDKMMQFNRRFNRWPLAKYIYAKYNKFFGVLIADEVHQYKAKGSDQGKSFQTMINATNSTITLTGTLFGGKSTSIFWLYYRLDPKLRDQFGFHDERRWTNMYGRQRFIITKSNDTYGTYSAGRRHTSRAAEIPGISPQIIKHILPTTIFAKVADLGLEMPGYAEEIVNIEMDAEHYEQYQDMYDFLMTHVKNSSFSKDKMSWLSLWLQWSLGRPNSAFRSEVIKHLVGELESGEKQYEEVYYLNAIDETLAKERWMASYIASEREQKRKVIVYVRQTGKRDIQEHIAQTMRDAGLRATVLPASIKPAKRAEWIKKNVDNIDVLIVNPRKVETGLNLVMFSTAIFFEPDYSLYTLWQAMRRIWRPGQEDSVKILFAVYNDAMEEKALALMGEKLKAAMLLYGDNAASAIAPEMDDGDFLGELARRIIGGEKFTVDGLQGLLKPSTDTTTSPLGSPTQKTMPIAQKEEPKKRISFNDFLAAIGEDGKKKRKKNKKNKAQLGFGF